MNNSLGKEGLSMTDAQILSNLMVQRVYDIDRTFNGVNNAKQVIRYNGETLTLVEGKPLPDNILDLLAEKVKLLGAVAFLRENVKFKDAKVSHLQNEYNFKTTVEYPELEPVEQFVGIPEVTEDWGWNQLSTTKLNKYYQDEAIAAHYGQFIHKGGILDKLRADVAVLPAIEWKVIKRPQGNEELPVQNFLNPSHTSEELLKLHETLAGKHRAAEKRVNYVKATVKNSVTLENARTAKLNQDEYVRVSTANAEVTQRNNVVLTKYRTDVQTEEKEFTTTNLNNLKEAADLKISVDPIFQEIITEYVDKLKEKE